MANYQLAISNIAWHKEDDEAVYTAMQQAGFTGLEIAPTRIFPEMPRKPDQRAAVWRVSQKPVGLLGAQHAKHLVRPDRQHF